MAEHIQWILSTSLLDLYSAIVSVFNQKSITNHKQSPTVVMAIHRLFDVNGEGFIRVETFRVGILSMSLMILSGDSKRSG